MRKRRTKEVSPQVWVAFYHEARMRANQAERDMQLARHMVSPGYVIVDEYDPFGSEQSVLKPTEEVEDESV